MRKEKTQVSRIRNAKGEITTNTMEVQEIIRDDFKNRYSNKFENLKEMERFLDTYDHPKLNQEDINHLNRSVTQNEIEAAIKSLPKIYPKDCETGYSRGTCTPMFIAALFTIEKL
jgi:hypothetical protein